MGTGQLTRCQLQTVLLVINLNNFNEHISHLDINKAEVKTVYFILLSSYYGHQRGLRVKWYIRQMQILVNQVADTSKAVPGFGKAFVYVALRISGHL